MRTAICAFGYFPSADGRAWGGSVVGFEVPMDKWGIELERN